MERIFYLIDQRNMLCDLIESADECLKGIYEKSFRARINELAQEIDAMIDALATDDLKKKEDNEYEIQ